MRLFPASVARAAFASLFALCLFAAGTTVRCLASETVWSDDSLPAGAVPLADGRDSWTWVASDPQPASGAAAHQSAIAAGLHEHFFNYASPALPVGTGEVLFVYVHLDPANPPSELMLSWNSDGWEHRAYWGGNLINYGTDGTAGRHYVGALPLTGQWVRLEVSARDVGLEGQAIVGMGFSTYDGRVTWDKAGVATEASANSGSSTATNGTRVITVPVTNTGGTASSSGSLAAPALSNVDYTALQLPKPGESLLHILSPTLLELMGLPKPAEMTGTSLMQG